MTADVLLPRAKQARWESRLFYLVFIMLLLAPLCLVMGQALAHGKNGHEQHESRPELTFGRTEQYDYDPPVPGSYHLPRIKRAGDGAVLDSDGSSHQLSDLLKGHITVLAFIYTRCMDPEGCPMSMSLLYDIEYVKEKDRQIGSALNIMAMSFDPKHDTPQVMAEYGYGKKGRVRGKDDIFFLTTASEKDIAPILKAYDQATGRKKNPDDNYGPLTHQLRVYLIDRKGWIRNIYSLGFMDPRLVITDIRTLLMEEASAGQ